MAISPRKRRRRRLRPSPLLALIAAASALLAFAARAPLAATPGLAAAADTDEDDDAQQQRRRLEEGGEGCLSSDGGDGGNGTCAAPAPETHARMEGEEEEEGAADADADGASSCVDDHDEVESGKCREWADDGECVSNPGFMMTNCRRSCWVCGFDDGDGGKGREEDDDDESTCANEHAKCDEWAEAGECEANPHYMLNRCRSSCGSCRANVTKDSDFGEPQRITGMEAEMTAALVRHSVHYMKKVRSRVEYKNVRTGCLNQHEDCAFWAVLGECQSNPGYMQTNCAPSCQSCEQLDILQRCPMDPDAVDALQPGDLNKMFRRILDPKEGADAAKYEPYAVSRPRSEGGEEEREGEESRLEVEDGPWVVAFDKFLTPAECDRLVWHGHQAGYERSQDVGKIRPDGTHDGIVSDSRTSLNAWCNETCKADPIVSGVIDRIADVTGVPRMNSEDLQLLEYSVGQYYVQHHDYIEYQTERPCGVRILTFFLYLNDVEAGGGTRFPDLNLTVHPKKGKALLWPSVLDAKPNRKDGRTDHEALAVEGGIKYGANAWLHMRDFQTPLLNNCHN